MRERFNEKVLVGVLVQGCVKGSGAARSRRLLPLHLRTGARRSREREMENKKMRKLKEPREGGKKEERKVKVDAHHHPL